MLGMVIVSIPAQMSATATTTAAAATESATEYACSTKGLNVAALHPERRYHDLIGRAIELLDDILTKHNVCASHGTAHAYRVALHTARALRCCAWKKTEKQHIATLLAALLHDADDRKFFPANQNYENARSIIRGIGLEPDVEDFAISMIKAVSTSTNGNSIPAEVAKFPFFLYPRYSDRIEAIGWGGVVRCLDYTLTSKTPLFVATTARCRDEKELATIATAERFSSYKGESASMVDHYYDKLLHIGTFLSGNAYLNNMVRKGQAALVEVCLEFGKTGTLSETFLERARALAITCAAEELGEI